jgi:hypothetical protein
MIDTGVLERQRRSRIDWEACVPRDVAQKQIRFERVATVAALRKQGMTLRAAAAFFGGSAQRILLMEREGRKYRMAPVERYFAEMPEIVFPRDRPSLPLGRLGSAPRRPRIVEPLRPSWLVKSLSAYDLREIEADVREARQRLERQEYRTDAQRRMFAAMASTTL